MIPCINQATVLPTDTIRFVELARKSSFTAIELDIGKVEECVGKVGLTLLQRTLRDSGLQIVSLNAIENYPIMTQDEMSRSLRRCEEVLSLCRSLDCDILVVNPNEVSEPDRVVMARKFDDFMNETNRIADNLGVRLGFEYVSYEDRVVHSLSESLNGLRRWNRGVGLVLDVFHMYRSGESFNEISSKDSSLIWAFHVSDSPKLPISDVRDSDRLMPLEGVINLRGYISKLKELGFGGPISVELFNKKYWEMDPDFVVAKAKASLNELRV
jgi:2-keto-myo-inositol isomerase